MTLVFGAQSQRFDGIVQAIAASKAAVWKTIDPDSDILRAIKAASPATTTIVRIYTGAPTIDDAVQHPDPEAYGREYATYVYSKVQTPQYADFHESPNEPNDHYGNLTEFIKRQNAFLVGFSTRAKELGFRPLGPNFSTGYPEVYVPNTDYELWPNAWAGLADGLRALRDARGALSLHEYDSPDLFRLWSDAQQRGYLIGRHKAVYQSLPADLQTLPLYITEFGIDWMTQGVQGGFWHNRDEHAYDYMLAQTREAWRRVYSTTLQLAGIAFFLWGTTDAGHFAEYDLRRTDESIAAFTQFFGDPLPMPTPAAHVLSDTELATLVTAHGFAQPAVAMAVILAESGGNANAVNTASNTPPSQDRGLFQLNSYWHPEVSDACAFDPDCAAGAALRISSGGSDFSSWTAYTTGSYQTYLPRAQAALHSIGTTMLTPQELSAAVPFTVKQALAWSLGQHLYGEAYPKGADGHTYAVNVFSGGGVVVDTASDFGPTAAKYFDLHTFAIADAPPSLPPVVPPPVPPVVVPPLPQGVPYKFPLVLTLIGAVGEEGTPFPGQPFYRLTGATVRRGISAFCVVTVLGKSGAPKIGVTVCNIFPDGNGDLPQQTDGQGTARFQFGASSAFTNPGTGPFTVFVADDSAFKDSDSTPKRVVYQARLSDITKSLGDFQGTHTEIYLQLQEQ